MSYIGQQLPADVFSGFTTDSFTGDGSATTFTLSKAPFSEDGLIVVINNVIQQPTTNFTVSGTTLTIVGTAVANGDPLYAIHTSGAVPSTLASKVDVNGLSDGVILDADGDSTISADTDDQIDFKAGGTDTMHIINGKVGIGTSSPSTNLHVFSTADNAPHVLLENFQNADTDDAAVIELYLNDETTGGIGDNTDVGVIRFTGDEKDGGTKETYAEIRGVAADPGSGSSNKGHINFFVQNAGSLVQELRIDSEGDLVMQSGTIDNSTADLKIYSTDSNHGGLRFASGYVGPISNDGGTSDGALSLGGAIYRWATVYATSGSINTSDRNEKQDIEELTDAEKRVAVAAKGLLRKYKWKDAVEEKGDKARTHFGIIAQDLEDAFTAEGLDASKYGMFCSDTWWETEDDSFETEEEAPEGATKRTRLGIRYSELLAFIIGGI